ncbi:MAG: universal stress protein [bacterium]
MKINNILCPVDFSEHSDQALKYATFLARTHDAKLTVLHVIEHLHGFDHYMILALTPQEINEKMEHEARIQLESSVDRINGGAKVETDVRVGKAFVEIIKKAKEDNIDLKVIGSHGRSGLAHTLIGSVAEKVTRKAPCPVLVVKNRDTTFAMP